MIFSDGLVGFYTSETRYRVHVVLSTFYRSGNFYSPSFSTAKAARKEMRRLKLTVEGISSIKVQKYRSRLVSAPKYLTSHKAEGKVKS